ncbi:hypothetical protein [Microcoleus sp. herbarium14]|uniref:hypothetical protein n=1 Tax=Microcoleus sp. herbarium14 TaxID=3055439 RepID=UPI002FCF7082
MKQAICSVGRVYSYCEFSAIIVGETRPYKIWSIAIDSHPHPIDLKRIHPWGRL